MRSAAALGLTALAAWNAVEGAWAGAGGTILLALLVLKQGRPLREAFLPADPASHREGLEEWPENAGAEVIAQREAKEARDQWILAGTLGGIIMAAGLTATAQSGSSRWGIVAVVLSAIVVVPLGAVLQGRLKRRHKDAAVRRYVAEGAETVPARLRDEPGARGPVAEHLRDELTAEQREIAETLAPDFDGSVGELVETAKILHPETPRSGAAEDGS